MNSYLNCIDLFAGAGGLSEGFVREGYNPIAHVEMDSDACDTLKTRIAFHNLYKKGKIALYHSYLKKEISREVFWSKAPYELISSVVNSEISNASIGDIFHTIDELNDSKKVDVIIGGPPCQAYSVVGRNRDPNRMRGDKRNFLFRYYGEFLNKYKPKVFVFENVLGILTAGNSKYFKEMLELFSDIGYSVDYKILNSEDYGVLQKRRRVIIMGRKGKAKFSFPELELQENSWQIKRDLLFDLPALKPGQESQILQYTKETNNYFKQSLIRNGVDFTTQHIARQHNERDLEIYSIAIDKWLNDRERLKYSDLPKRLQTHKNTKGFLDRFKVIDPYGHSHTIVAHISKDGHYYIYPDKKQIRSISVREAARIQSFPDDYFFEGGRTAAFKQIGNAVPPLMAQAFAKKIKEIM
jgi:DNA (cytosine-5)-methyltransferase 1